MSQVHVSTHPLALHKLTILRDQKTEPKRFRELVRELSLILIAEATAGLPVVPVTVTTPMGQAQGWEMKDRIGLVPILRAGLGMVDGALEMLPFSEVWHIGLYRDEHTLRPVQYYNKLPVNPTVQVCIVLDPMLATGGSATATIDILKKWGAERILYVGLIGSPEGVQHMQTDHPDVPIYLAAIDDHLNEVGYIVPGLGDAGDRQFGTA
ncbi:MAG: uracil phosphoribosyltransferase [Candidatus Roseilinea sp.]|uniref:uracil phosphoribosyltransferase n=1 Tax=Candidatus Roseilinea sp. TaxID=2838777 RepID=UPI004049B121